MKIIIVGAEGFVGKALQQHFGSQHTIIPYGHKALDIRNQPSVFENIENVQPDVVINCATISVDRCEQEPTLAHQVNALGTQYLARACSKVDAVFVHYSTNYVFGAHYQKDKIYTYLDTPDPVNVYGDTKYAGEKLALSECAKTIIIRTSWIFGVGKDNFLSTAPTKLAAHNQIAAVSDIWANPTYLIDLCERTEAIIDKKTYGIYHVINEGYCTHYEFSEEVAKQLTLTPAEVAELIKIKKAEQMDWEAKRPISTPMRCLLSEKIGLPPLRSWQEAIAAYIKKEVLHEI